MGPPKLFRLAFWQHHEASFCLACSPAHWLPTRRFVVLGSTKNYYKVELRTDKQSCECMDHRLRRHACKHIRCARNKPVLDKSRSYDVQLPLTYLLSLGCGQRAAAAAAVTASGGGSLLMCWMQACSHTAWNC